MEKRARFGMAALLVTLITASTALPAVAQSGSGWHGQTSQMGDLKMKENDKIEGEEILVTGKFYLEEDLREKDATWWVFSFIWQGTPLSAEFVSLKTSSGNDIRVSQVKTEEGKVQWQVDVADLPPENTEIHMTARVGAEDRGLYQFGAMVMAFDYRWNKLRLDDGNRAELYSYTQVGVQQTTDSLLPGPLSNLLNVPGPGALLAAMALGATAVATATRRRGG